MKKYKTCAGWEGKIEAERSGPRRSGRYSLKLSIKINILMIMTMMIMIMVIMIMVSESRSEEQWKISTALQYYNDTWK